MNIDKKMRRQFIRDAGYEPTSEELQEYIKNNEALMIESTKGQNKGDKLVGALVLIWFFLSIGSLLYLASLERTVELLVVFGHYFLVFGIMVLISNFKKINTDAAFKILFSLGIVFVLYIDFLSDGIKIKMNKDMFGFFVLGSIFFVTGIGMLISVIKKNILARGIKIQATVCAHKKDGDASTCVYEYDYNGYHYKYCDNYYTTDEKPAIGSVQTIKVNPGGSNETNYSLLFMAIPFILMGGLFVFVSLFAK